MTIPPRTEPTFDEPPWDAPLDTALSIQAMPEDATISGMFLAPLVDEARRRGVVLPGARERYLAFRFYPLREHASLLVDAATAFFPELSTRQALRKLGRGGPRALVASTLGRVLLGSVEGVTEAFRAMARAYPLNAHPSRVEIESAGEQALVVHMDEIHYFIDSHHIGVFEGLMRYAGVDGRVSYASRGTTAGDLLCEW